ncbi:glycosyltransferase [Marinomonas arenicola]|uniref:Glycosyltransferase n=1 Tax=Marinomonas arenicola TaxID=569601 RepID=A0ABU9G5M5_9GAMM
MLVSVITVMYQPILKELKETLDSIMSQNFDDFELILQDGGTNDDEFIKLINSYVESYHNINFESKKDSGIYDAMNRASSRSSGEYLVFINVGDLFFNNYSLMNASLNFLNRPDLVAYLNVAYGDPSRYSIIKQKKISKIIIRNLCHQSYFLKRSLCVFNVGYKLAADFDLLLNLFHKDISVTYVDDVISYYKPGGVSDENKVSVYFQILKSISKSKNVNLHYKIINVLFYIVRIFREKI